MINKSKKLAGPFLIDLKNRFREIAGKDQLIDKNEFLNGLALANKDISKRLFDIETLLDNIWTLSNFFLKSKYFFLASILFINKVQINNYFS